jgi:hypothetical protein
MRNLAVVPILAAALLAAACGKSTTGQRGSSLSVSARGAPGGAVAPTGALTVSPTLTVLRVRVVVKDIDLEPAEAPPATTMPMPSPMPRDGDMAAADHGSDDGDDHPEGEVRVGPFLVDLSGADLAGAVTSAFDADIPPGSYRELRLDVEPVSPSDAGADTGLVEMAGMEASVAIDGVAGTGPAVPFHVNLPLRARVKKETTFTVGAGTTNVTLSVDPVAWFAGVDDPTTDAGKAKLTANILTSLGVFLDDDHDGEDDHGDDHGGDGGGHD